MWLLLGGRVAGSHYDIPEGGVDIGACLSWDACDRGLPISV